MHIPEGGEGVLAVAGDPSVGNEVEPDVALMLNKRRAGAQRALHQTKGVCENPKQCGPLVMGGDWHAIVASLLDHLSVEELSEMSEIVKGPSTGVKKQGLRATILIQIASHKEQGVEYPGVRVPVEKIPRKWASGLWMDNGRDRNEIVASMTDMSLRLLEETYGGGGTEEEYTDRKQRSLSKKAFRCPLKAPLLDSRSAGGGRIGQQTLKTSVRPGHRVWSTLICAPMVTPIHKYHLILDAQRFRANHQDPTA